MWASGLKPLVDRIWLWVQFNKTPIYPMFHLFKGDYMFKVHGLGFRSVRCMGSTLEGLGFTLLAQNERLRTLL